MNPETSADRANLLGDFGVACKVRPASGAREFVIVGILARGTRRESNLDLDGIADFALIGTDPWLQVTADDVARCGLAERDRVTVPGEPFPFRVHTIEPMDEDAGYRRVDLLEAEP